MDRSKGKLPVVNIYVSKKNFCHIFGNIPRSQANDFTKSSVKMICHFVITVVVIMYISFNSKSTSECSPYIEAELFRKTSLKIKKCSPKSVLKNINRRLSWRKYG